VWINFSDIPDEGLQVELQESLQEFHLETDDVKISSQVGFEGRLDRVGSDVLIRGHIKTVVEVACARCLEHFPLPIAARVEAEYRPRPKEPQEEEKELKDEDINVYFYAKNRLYLSEALRDQILLAVPMKPLCKRSCKGLCSRCGADLNRGPCGCVEEDMDPRLEVLKALKKAPEER
jgi:uncharacterized protein